MPFERRRTRLGQSDVHATPAGRLRASDDQTGSLQRARPGGEGAPGETGHFHARRSVSSTVNFPLPQPTGVQRVPAAAGQR
ncbi:hypothetical protein JCM9534A_79050 [Catenuloplanes indicus JCM 9534]